MGNELSVWMRPKSDAAGAEYSAPRELDFAFFANNPADRQNSANANVSRRDDSACFNGLSEICRGDSDVDHASPPLNLFKRDQLSVSGAGTRFAHCLPGVVAFEIRVPEGPSAALCGTRGVNTAATRLGIEKRTVAVFVLGE
jgi:hypothetical protein